MRLRQRRVRSTGIKSVKLDLLVSWTTAGWALYTVDTARHVKMWPCPPQI